VRRIRVKTIIDSVRFLLKKTRTLPMETSRTPWLDLKMVRY